MKKLLKTLPVLIFVLILSLTGLSGCQIFSAPQPEQGNIDQTPRDRRIGVIQSLGGVKTSSQGTNLLTMDDGTTILLKSIAINLDDTKYANKKVEVSGVLTYTTDAKQIMVVENIDILDEAPVTQQRTVVSWRDYVNAGFGFQVKYRDDFTISEDKSSLTFTRPVAPGALLVSTQENSSTSELSTKHLITLVVQPHGTTQSLLKDFVKLSDDKSSTLLASGYSKSKIGLSGLVAYKKVEGQSVSFAFEGDGRFYLVTYEGGNDSQSIEDQNVFYDFLASFQLLNGSSATQQVTESDTVNNRPATTGSDTIGTSTVSTKTGASTSDKTGVTEQTVTPVKTVTPPTPPDVIPTPVPTPPVSTSSTGSSTTVSATQELLPGYSMFTSSGYKFNLQYPKGWYYGQTASTDTGVIRRYDFGNKPVDTEPGSVNFDIVSGGLPAGTTYTLGDKTLMKTTDGTTISYSYQGKNGRVYRVSGPSNMDASLRNMMETLQEQ